MKNKQIWIAFLSCIALIALWFSINTGYKTYRWITQTETAKPISIEWNIEQQASDRFALTAAYTFIYKEKKIDGKTLFQSKRYKNPQAADHFLDEYSHKDWTVSYSSFNPQNSTIYRFFPLKSCIYTAIVCSILLYFIWLSSYIGKLYR